MKIALITDTHYGARKGSKIFHDYFQKFYDDVFFPTIKERKIKHAIHLGDSFDNRKTIDFWALNWAKEHVYNKFKDLKVKVHTIVGNHDVYYKNTNEVNAVDSLLASYNNIVRYSGPTEIDIEGFKTLLLPWICQDNYNETLEAINKSKLRSVFGHLELNGFALFPGQVMTHAVSGLDVSAFKKFDVVFSGHYHTRSNDGKVFYLGNPYQIFWNDAGDARGFHIFDTETYELEFIRNPYAIFEKVYYDDNNSRLYDARHLKDKIVKIIVRKKSSQLEFDKFIDKIDKAGCYDFKVVENFTIDDESVDFTQDEYENTLTLLNKYIEDSDFDLDKEVVKDIMKDVYREACEFD